MAVSKRRNLLKYLPLFFILPLIFSGFELQSSNPKGNGSFVKKKIDHLVLGPAAGQGLRDRIQCQGLRAVNRRPLLSLSRLSSVKETVSFVTVFAIYNESLASSADRETSAMVTVGNLTYDRTGRSMEILNVFANFIKAFTGDYSRNNLMLQRIKSYIAFLETRLTGHIRNLVNHFIFTDSDIAVVDDLSSIFEDYPDFHIGLTFRNNKNQPLNSGLIAVRGTPEGISKAKSFLEDVLEAYKSMFMKASRMLGDQLALAWVVKNRLQFDIQRFRYAKAFVVDTRGMKVLFLPCAIYNWTPPEGAGQFHGMPEDVKVIHFKGSRKRLMIESWNFFNSFSTDFSDMMCLILKSGRTKYDF